VRIGLAPLQGGPIDALALARVRRMRASGVADMPTRVTVHRTVDDRAWPGVQGLRRPGFGQLFRQYVDIDAAPPMRSVCRMG